MADPHPVLITGAADCIGIVPTTTPMLSVSQKGPRMERR